MSTDNKNINFLGFIIWFIAALFFLYEYFLRTFIGSLAQQVLPDLHLNAETFSILGSAYYLAYGIMQIPVGILADKFGVKKILIFATLVCAAACFIFSRATGFPSALVGRILMGFGSSFAFISLLVIAITWFPRKYFGFFAGFSQFFGTMGPLLAGGPLIAFITSQHLSWRTAMFYIAIIGIVLSVLVLLIVRSKARDGEHVLVFLSTHEPFFAKIKRLFQNKQAWLIALYSATNYVSLSLMGAIWGTEYLETKGLTQTHAADVISFAWLGFALACPALGAISDSIKRRKPILILTSVVGLGATALIVYGPFHHSFLIYSLLFIGLGIAASGQNIGFATISEQVPQDTRASALGLNNGLLMLTASVIPPLASYFIELSAKNHPQHLQTSDFTVGLSIMPILYSIAIILSLFFIKETFCKPQKEALRLKVE